MPKWRETAKLYKVETRKKTKEHKNEREREREKKRKRERMIEKTGRERDSE